MPHRKLENQSENMLEQYNRIRFTTNLSIFVEANWKLFMIFGIYTISYKYYRYSWNVLFLFAFFPRLHYMFLLRYFEFGLIDHFIFLFWINYLLLHFVGFSYFFNISPQLLYAPSTDKLIWFVELISVCKAKTL